MFSLSRRVLALDHFRVPCRVDGELDATGLHSARAHAGGPALLWPVAEPPSGGQAPIVGAALLTGDADASVPLFASMLPDGDASRRLTQHGGSWERINAILDRDDELLGSIWRDRAGNVFFPFDPDEVLLNYWSERYRSAQAGVATALRSRLTSSYYRVRPLLPRAGQLWLRRRFLAVQVRSRFPRWPVETGLHDFLSFLMGVLTEVAGEPVPYIGPWPAGHEWALVLTHDVEHAEGFAAIDPVVALEQDHDLRSAWNIVPRRYPVDVARLRRLSADGFEVGVHGLYHDGRDLGSLETLQQRLPEIRAAAAQWGATGFRAPSTQRDWELIPLLEFDYDSSYPDTDPYEPIPGGCCSIWPFFIGDTVELPITMPQDHTLFMIMGHGDESVWVNKTEWLRAQGGMALIDTHPDYLVQPRVFAAYRRFLERFADDAGAWRVLPRDVSAWWRRRAASQLQLEGDTWAVGGPAADEAQVLLWPRAQEGDRAAVR